MRGGFNVTCILFPDVPFYRRHPTVSAISPSPRFPHARRFVEAGVRFVQVTCQADWDHHRNLKAEHTKNAAAVDKPIAALLADLKQRDLLKDTLVIWGGKFGRTPGAQNGDGRDHNVKGFTM